MITAQELEKLLVKLESDRFGKTVSETDKDKFGEVICSFSNDIANHQAPAIY